MAWFGRRKHARRANRAARAAAELQQLPWNPSDSLDESTPEAGYVAVVEAIAWWRAKLPNGRAVLADAATHALVVGADGSALAELAGLRRLENPFVVDDLVELVIDEQGLHEPLRGSPKEIAVRRMCRAVLAGEMSERDLSQWVHWELHHESDSDLLNLMAELDDEYDEAEYSKAGPADVQRRIRQLAARMLQQAYGSGR